MKFILDVSKWRSGGEDGPNTTGKGKTLLLNENGFMCCLGQFSEQQGVSLEEMKGADMPSALNRVVPELCSEYRDDEDHFFVDTDFSRSAVTINDDDQITIDERIKGLTELCKAHGHELEVINKP